MEKNIIELLERMRKADALRLAEQKSGAAHPKARRGLTDKQRYLKQLKGGFRK